MTYGLHHTDCLDLMRSLQPQSVNLILCDSPYANTDLAFDKQPVDWPAWWAEVRRVLVPNGVVVCFAAEGFTLDLIASNRAWYAYRRVWCKTKATRYLDAKWRPLSKHEDVVVFSPQIKSATYNPQKLQHNGPRVYCKRKPIKSLHYKSQRDTAEYKDDGTRYPSTLLEFGSLGTMTPHFNPTAKPHDLIQDLVLTYSNEGDTVLEPFAGDAPAAHACLNTRRRYIGCEVNLEQYEWSRAHLRRCYPLFADTLTA